MIPIHPPCIHRLERSGQRALRFTGSLLGEADSYETAREPHPLTRQRAYIYFTTTGRYVGYRILYLSGEGNHYDADVFDAATDLVDWFEDPHDGKIPEVFLTALERAGEVDPDIEEALSVDV